MRSAGLLRAAQVVSTGAAGAVTASGANAAVDTALCAALRQLVTSGRNDAWAIPSVSTDSEGAPRFFVASSEAYVLAEALDVEYGPTGVDTELRLFLGEALAAGDVYIDAAPGLGFASLTAATIGIPVRVLALVDDPVVSGGITTSATLSGCADAVDVSPLQPLDTLAFPDLASTAYAIVHAGHATNVAPLLAGARAACRAGVIGAVAWSRSDGDVDTAAAVLSVLGYQHFVLAEDDAGMQLIPAETTTAGSMVFSLSAEFMERAERSAMPMASGDALEHAATVLFDAVAEELAPGARALGGVPSKGQLTTAQLDMAWADAQVVSFDIFDTLVVRNVSSPDDVFLHLARREPFDALGLAPALLAQHRTDAEEEARRRGYAKRGSTEVTLHEVHAVLAERLQLGDGAVAAMVAAEEAVELALCEAHPTGRRWFTRAVDERKTCWCLSDTCHEPSFLKTLLEHCGYDTAGLLLFSSATVRSTKSEGGLFRHVLRETGVSPSSVLHVGDHPVGDEQVPLSLGLQAVLHPWAALRSGEPAADRPGDSLVLGVAMIGARAHEPPPPFWFRFGYSVAGPLLSGFALWLRERFARDGIDRAYFLLRDGEILQAVYEQVCGASSGPPTSLLESSRRVFVVPAFESHWSTLRAQITATESPRPAREFLERFGVRTEALAGAFREAGFASLDEMVDPEDRTAMLRIAALMARPEVNAALAARSRDERALLLDYLAQEGVLHSGRTALVDIGWNATIQKSLMAALHVEGRTADVRGYYLGTLGAAHVDLGGSTVAGYLFEAGRPIERRQAVMQLPQLLEFVCSTTRGSLRGFARDGGRVIPVHGPVEHDAAQQEVHEALRAGALAFAQTFARHAAALGVNAVSPDAAVRRFARVVSRPTAEEAAHIGAIRHGEGLATDRVRSLASFSPEAFTVDAIHHDVTQAYWPAGLAARRSAQALVLRTLQWLSESEQE